MLNRLQSRGFLQPAVRDAMRQVRRSALLPPPMRPLAHLDQPLPVGPGVVGLSPHTAALLLAHLDVEPGHRVLIGAPDPYLAALASHLAGREGEIVLAGGTPGLTRWLAERLEQAQTGGPIRCVSRIPYQEAHYDRILFPDEEATLPTSARVSLAPWGVLLARLPRDQEMDLVRIAHVEDDYAEMMLGDLHSATDPMGDGGEEDWPLRRLLALEEALRHVWTGTATGPEEEAFAEAVDETWRPEPERGATEEEWLLARRLFHLGYVTLLAGDLDGAEDAFQTSLDVADSAEGHTFLGWVASFRGDYQEAIAECKQGIQVDPEFGNPYNDIGAYYLELGDPMRAEMWLKRAMHAPRYGARAYPHANLARARIMQGDIEGARRALVRAIEIDPTYIPAWHMLDQLDELED